MPGVQKPHCNPCFSINALCKGCKSPSFAKPSIVSISLPFACTPSIVQDLTALPSTKTVHAPQFDVSQALCVPVSPRSSLSTLTSNLLGSNSSSTGFPFTLKQVLTFLIVTHRRSLKRSFQSVFHQDIEHFAPIIF